MTVVPINLRDYQNNAVNNALDYIKHGGKAGILALPTGTGKSLVIASIALQFFVFFTKKYGRNFYSQSKEYDQDGRPKVLILTHSKELVAQNFNQIGNFNKSEIQHNKAIADIIGNKIAPRGVHSQGAEALLNSPRSVRDPIILGTIQTAYQNIEQFENVNVLIIDECHRVSSDQETQYGKLIEGLKAANPNLIVLGLSATPYRQGEGHLVNGRIFKDMVFNNTQREHFHKLIQNKYLCPLVGISPKKYAQLDVKKIKQTMGDFKERDLDKHFNRSEVTKKIVSETAVLASDRKKGLAFCINKLHAEDMSEKFNEIGWSAAYLHSDIGDKTRKQILKDYKQGKFKVLCNVGILTTGFDEPSIDFIVMARPTRSTSLHVQMLGRGTRPHHSKKNTKVLDYGGNIRRLGFIEDPQLPEFDNSYTKTVKICPKCKSYVSQNATSCMNCELAFSTTKKKSEKEIVPESKVHVGDVMMNESLGAKTKKNVEKPKKESKKKGIEIKQIKHGTKSISIGKSVVARNNLIYALKRSSPKTKAKMYFHLRDKGGFSKTELHAMGLMHPEGISWEKLPPLSVYFITQNVEGVKKGFAYFLYHCPENLRLEWFENGELKHLKPKNYL